ncbi:MAG: MEDS domain-containing protein [Gemmatimonadaceae bacterium]
MSNNTPPERPPLSLAMQETMRAWVPGHDVQFYEDEDFLASTVAAFLVEGFRAGQPLVVIATPAHRRAFAARMLALGVDPEDLVHGRDVIWLDADQTLSAFMEGGRPNAELFSATVGNVFERLMLNRRYVVVRAYGEMVDRLWKDGKAEGAIALEKLWNGLAVQYSFSLLCAYSKASLLGDTQPDGLERICGQHARVLPSEFQLSAEALGGLGSN